QNVPKSLRIGESLTGQCAQERQPILIDDIPRDSVRVGSVLGSLTPLNVIIQPLLFDGAVQGVLELASLKRFSEAQLALLGQLSDSVGAVMRSIEAVERG